MKKMQKSAFTTVTILLLSGCGLKGPLYFPPKESPTPQKTVPAEEMSEKPLVEILQTKENIAGNSTVLQTQHDDR